MEILNYFIFSTHIYDPFITTKEILKKRQKNAKAPNQFFGATKDQKAPSFRDLAHKAPNWQPWTMLANSWMYI